MPEQARHPILETDSMAAKAGRDEPSNENPMTERENNKLEISEDNADPEARECGSLEKLAFVQSRKELLERASTKK